MFAIIMCGGSGTRFWPVSRRRKPKQFLDITGRGPMVVETCDRLRPAIRDEEMILVLGQEHLEHARDLFRGRGVHMVAEPVGRNTAPCIGLGAIYAQHLGCKEAVAFLPADHFIGDPSSFLRALEAAGKLAASGGIATLGIVPSRPETGYGYIRRDSELIEADGGGAYRVLAFVEKPDLETARRYLTDGDYYWNGGIFVATPETILREMERHLPDLHKGLMRLRDALGTERFEAKLKEVYEELEGISFDYGIMEKTGTDVYVVPCECGWSDVGSWASLYELKTKEHDKNQNLTDGETLLVDCEKSFISSQSGRLVACLGINNCLVVDTPDTVLVSDLNRSQEIRKIVDQLKKSGKEKLL
ncbi:MAG: NTP transferase domain-containing protein [Desulfobacteraceae bacterium]|nr:NTP transferase domain-containing protein [Desulfobacteraceae bacterium]